MNRIRWMVGILFLSHYARGQEISWTAQSARPLGMGDAFVSIADDQNALYYNPAGLARIESWQGELFNLFLNQSPDSKDFIDSVGSVSTKTSSTPDELIDIIRNHSGETHHYQLGWRPFVVGPGFGLGMALDSGGTVRAHNYPSLDMNVGLNITVPVGFAFNALDRKLSYGAVVKFKMIERLRTELSLEYLDALNSETEEDRKEIIREYFEGGFGAGVDLGLLYSPNHDKGPTLGISISSLGGLSYSPLELNEYSLSVPQTLLPSLNIGVSSQLLSWKGYTLRHSLEVHSINQNFSYSKKLRLGGEFGLLPWMKVQLGYYNGRPTFGIQMDGRLLSIRIASYTEEIGLQAGDLPNQRLFTQLKILF